jgi:hypothetical protein
MKRKNTPENQGILRCKNSNFTMKIDAKKPRTHYLLDKCVPGEGFTG